MCWTYAQAVSLVMVLSHGTSGQLSPLAHEGFIFPFPLDVYLSMEEVVHGLIIGPAYSVLTFLGLVSKARLERGWAHHPLPLFCFLQGQT